MQNANLITEFYVSSQINHPIIDSSGHRVASLRDIAMSWHTMPPFARGVKFKKDSNRLINIKYIDQWTNDSIVLGTSLEDAADIVAKDEDIYVIKWLLDKQVIDLRGKKIVRVNDILLSFISNNVEKKLVLLALDVGFSGILRRLGIHFLDDKVKPQLISWHYLAQISNRASNLQIAREFNRLKDLHPADIADIIEELNQIEREKIIESLDTESAAEVLAEADIDTQIDVIGSLNADKAAEILDEMPSDDAAEILSELSEEKSQEIINHMDPEEANEVLEVLKYEEDEVGSLMAKDYLTLTGEESVEEALDKIKKTAEDVDYIYVSYIVDSTDKLIGVISLRDILISPQGKLIKDIMNTNVIRLNHFDHSDVALEMFAKYSLFVMPVVNNDNKIIGIVTVDDILRLLIPDRSEVDTFSRFDSIRKFLKERVD